ncbi:hypothetical protein Hanom_Chr04g00345491 [Helianthus anomalus]
MDYTDIRCKTKKRKKKKLEREREKKKKKGGREGETNGGRRPILSSMTRGFDGNGVPL